MDSKAWPIITLTSLFFFFVFVSATYYFPKQCVTTALPRRVAHPAGYVRRVYPFAMQFTIIQYPVYSFFSYVCPASSFIHYRVVGDGMLRPCRPCSCRWHRVSCAGGGKSGWSVEYTNYLSIGRRGVGKEMGRFDRVGGSITGHWGFSPSSLLVYMYGKSRRGLKRERYVLLSST
ncbi:hypothetical protein BU24DRAFT_163858 [Aaosphaeria arxii CBS 175.79]|uniref:Uncharacterized protein n=1 Tax=Aaosphaeria arxii CBS 175.79 TaxID=1450172 RepID=A0A6A5XXL7_9PLEO|nr:uncharacterized protein BU24DRAFT_163858 [Aaosphaeria arxii CBS 175.79]KAF2018048.1 hypothetical protein BU24DRAFT_163858 [Aaosphaeria arxii CBS 175.79]